MKIQTILLTLLCGLFLFFFVPVFGQSRPATGYNVTEAAMPQGKTLVFLFLPEDDMFYIPFQGNGDRLDELTATVDHYKKLITGVLTFKDRDKTKNFRGPTQAGVSLIWTFG